MKRRNFLAASCATGFASLNVFAAPGKKGKQKRREYYELRTYHIQSAEQKERFGKFMQVAVIPALNRIGIKKVGVFETMEKVSPIYVLLKHRSLRTILNLTEQLSKDEDFLSKGKKFLDTPASNPLYKRLESSVMVAFKGNPTLKIPSKKKSRIFQLRIYESHSVTAGQLKIEMFNNGELEIFRKYGLHPVFFGETLIGTKMPNLTYMVGFDNMEESKANWKKFVSSPEWKRLSSIPKYADKKIISNITNIFLKPAPYSQI